MVTNENDDLVADDDDLWVDDDDDDGHRTGISPLIVILLAVAVLGVVAILVATRKGDDEAGVKGDRTSTTDSSRNGRTTTTKPRQADWTVAVKSRPEVFGRTGDSMDKVTKTAKPGAYLWVDFDGWHLWVADPSGRTSARGTIISDKPFARAEPAVEGQGTVKREGGKITFDLSRVEAPLAGVDFNTGFYGARLAVDLEGSDLPLKLGTNMKNSPDPVVVDKSLEK